ncbi:MAG TPA: hypothetical protein ENN86_01790, partial [Desulfobacteraceae bacterium]|nr:hypothetical protein [Desulfobacteraceae bacterium]
MSTNPTTLKQAVEIISLLTTSVTNFRLYPQGSAITSNSIDRLLNALLMVLEKKDSIILAESEKAMLADGQLLSEETLKKPQVKTLIQLMLGLEIRSITIEKGFAKSEIIDLLEILSKKPAELQKPGEIWNIVSAGNMPHILL